MVHTAAAFAKTSNRMRTFACTSSIGPGATNMITGAAMATINRLPVLLLPGDIFAQRNVAPVLQQLESRARRIFRSTMLSSRFRAIGTASTGPSSCSDRVAGSDARAHVAGGDRRGDAGAAAGCAGRSVGLS